MERVRAVGAGSLGSKTDLLLAEPVLDDIIQPVEGAATHEQNVAGVDLDVLLLRMLASALRRYRGDGALHDLEQRLLYALARNVPGDRGVVRLAADLVDLIDVNDAALRALDVVIRRL